MAEFVVIHPLRRWSETGGWGAIYQGDNGPYEHAGRDGVDELGETEDAEVVACADGTVTVNHAGDGWGSGSFGTCARIDHPQGDGSYWSIAAHMRKNSMVVKTGDRVEQGQVLGRVGLTGLTTGFHTHWCIQKGGGGSFDPARFRDADGVWRIGNKQLMDPYRFLAQVAPPAAIDAVALAQAAAAKAEAAMREAVSINAAIMLRGGIHRIAFDPDLAKVEQAAAALRKAGFVV